MTSLVRRADTTPTEHAAAAPWAESVEVPAGSRWLYLSGQVPPLLDRAPGFEDRTAHGDMEAQTRGVLTRVKAKLQAAGFQMGDIVKLTCFLVGEPRFDGLPDLEGFGRAWREVFDEADLPARSRVQVTQLMDPEWLVEIEAVAARSER